MNIPPIDTAPLPGDIRPPPRKRHRVRKALLILGGLFTALIVLIVVISLATGHSTATPTARPSATTSAPATPTAPTPSARSSGYPREAADQALCTTYQALIQTGDTGGIRAEVAEASSAVTPSLATDMLRVANGTTLKQDEQNQLFVAMDCAIVSTGKQPVELNK